MEKKVFRSRISVLLTVIILAILIHGTIPAIQQKAFGSLYKTAGVLVFIAFISSGIRYEISGSSLYCKMWFITTGIANIADIISVKRTYNPLSSSAASLKRLYIYFNNNVPFPFWLISPAREQEFIEALKAIKPSISVNVPDRKGIWRIWDWDL
jgi:hypothetical protein